jgi:hypothetical protein
MRPYQIFAAMSPEQSIGFFRGLGEGSPAMLAQMVHAAAAAMKSRPAYVQKLKPEKKANAMRRALSRVGSDPLAEEMLAIYFLQCRKQLLYEWLDAIGLEHDEGTLKEDAPAQPETAKLRECVENFCAGKRAGGDDASERDGGEHDGGEADEAAADEVTAESPGDRELLLRAFAAQSAIEWPELDALIAKSD